MDINRAYTEEDIRIRRVVELPKRPESTIGATNLVNLSTETHRRRSNSGSPRNSASPSGQPFSAGRSGSADVHRKARQLPVAGQHHQQHHQQQQSQPSPVVAQMIKDEQEKLTLLDFDLDSIPGLHCFVDFSKPDALRNRALVAESRSLYVCDYYLSIWSPVFRDLFFGPSKCSKELVLPGKRYQHVLEFLECIYPQQKDITEHNLSAVLPLAFEYQTDGLLRRCMMFIKTASMKLMDKILLADRYNLHPLLNHCLRQLRITAQVDFNSQQYESLSDRTKVRLLEKLQNCRADYNIDINERIPELENTEPDPVQFAKFAQKSELYFGVLRIKNGRYFYCNPYYAAAWSRLLFEQVAHSNQTELNTNLTEEEAVSFLLASHPPLLNLSDSNAIAVLKAACKLEAPGLIRKCSSFMLVHSKSADLFDTFALFDRCYLHELLEPCLRRARLLRTALKFASHPTYDCLSTRAKACILDRVAALILEEPELSSHYCDKCRRRCQCSAVKWVCPNCGTYHSGERLEGLGKLY